MSSFSPQSIGVRALCLCATLFSAAVVPAQNKLPKPGSVAPALHLSSLIGAPAGTSTELPHGKTIVLEFWATWCAPCLGEIPAINALAHSLDPSRVQFISITDEDPAKIQRFLKTHPIAGWVGIDSSGVFDRYGVITRPATIVIGPDGKIVSNNITPDHLSRADLLAIAAGKSHHASATSSTAIASQVNKAQQAAMTQQFADSGAGSTQNALFALTITPASGTDTHVYHLGPQSIQILDGSVKSLLIFGLDIPEARLTLDEKSLPDKRYNLSVNAGDAPPDALASAIELAIASGTRVHISHHRAEEDVLLLKPASAQAATPTEALPHGVAYFDPRKDNLLMLGALPEDVAAAAEDAAGIAVIADAPGTPACNGQFHVARGDRQALTSALQSHCGLTLTPGRRTVDRIAVTP